MSKRILSLLLCLLLSLMLFPAAAFAEAEAFEAAPKDAANIATTGNPALTVALRETLPASGNCFEGDEITVVFDVTNTGNVDIEIDDFDWELNGQLVACTEIARLVLKPGESTAALSGSNAIKLIIAPVGRSDADHSTETDTIWGMMNFVCHARGYKPGTDTVLCTGSGTGTLTMLKEQPSLAVAFRETAPTDGFCFEGDEITVVFDVTNTGNVDIEIDDFDWELNGQLVACTEIARLVLKPGESTAALSGSNAIKLIIAPVGRSDADHSTETDTIWGMMNFVCHARGYKPGTDTVLCTGSGMGTLTMLKGSKTGWKQISGKWYYFSDGTVKTGWLKSGSAWFYLDPAAGGAMTTGWKKVGGTWYYFSDKGYMATGWKQIYGTWYYFESGGAMVTGWKQISGKWYYFQSDGAMVTGWKHISGKWYYFQSGGAMVTGWQKIGSTWYHFASGGAMDTGWLKSGSKWYYFESSGAMVTGWKKIGSSWYYFESSGAMLANSSRKIGSKTYYFNASGVCTNP